jgi:choline dehydrogenase-like flavoprotein
MAHPRRVNTLISARGPWGPRLIEEMEKYNHLVGLKIVGEILPQETNRVSLPTRPINTDCGFRASHTHGAITTSLIDHSIAFMTQALEAVVASDIWRQDDDTYHLNGTARMGHDPITSVVNTDCRSWDLRNPWICDGSVFPIVGGVNPSLTIQAIACRTADRIKAMAGRGDL